MLRITIPEIEEYDEEKGEFITPIKETSIQLEHSLVSLSKWESKWCKPFLTSKEPKTIEESVDYVRCMTITQNVDPIVYRYITNDNLDSVTKYIEEPMTATIISENKRTINREIVTAEIIYYWMVALNIPFECQKWHLNRLLTLINVCNIKNQPVRKMGNKDIMSRNHVLNEARRNAMNTKG